MTLRHLKIFIAVCKYKSTVEASKQLHIAQPSISLAIKEIEENYGIKLFDRISRKLIRTEDGKLFLSKATEIIDKFNNLESSMSDNDGKKIINLGCSTTIATFILPKILERYYEEKSNVKINLTIRDSLTLKNLILENKLDLALIETPIIDNSIISTSFYKDSLLLYLSKYNQLSKKESLELKDLIYENIILREKHSAVRYLIDSLFISNNIDKNITSDSTSTEAIISLVENNIGVSILSSLWKNQLNANTNIITKEIVDISLKREYLIIQHKNKNISKSIQSLINILTTTYSDSQLL